MYTAVATLMLRSGEQITARATAYSPEAEVEIHYTGAVHLLPRRCATGGPNDLKILFETFARELDAVASFTESGQYERWAE